LLPLIVVLLGVLLSALIEIAEHLKGILERGETFIKYQSAMKRAQGHPADLASLQR
jgi:hypothetical protein